MKADHFDYAVVGHSLAGISAALTLAKTGNRVALVDFHRDTDAIVDFPHIQPTTLGLSVSGMAFESAVRGQLERAHVEQIVDCFVRNIFFDGNAVVECTDRRWSCKGIVFAPNGTEPGVNVEGNSGLQGYGVSYSTAADAPFYASRPVALYGDVPRVLEHALIAARYASEIVVLLKGDLTENWAHLGGELSSLRTVTFEHRVVLRSLRAGSDSLLTGIELDASTGRRSIDVAALFVAQHLVPMSDVVSHQTPRGSIEFAGLAAGINYWSHAELVSDGARAARTLLTARQ
jgi:thioredoxin reductase